jgi:hypothetical protein
MALHMLGQIVTAVGAGYTPYVDQTIHVLLPLLSTDGAWFEDVRSYAVSTGAGGGGTICGGWCKCVGVCLRVCV